MTSSYSYAYQLTAQFSDLNSTSSLEVVGEVWLAPLDYPHSDFSMKIWDGSSTPDCNFDHMD